MKIRKQQGIIITKTRIRGSSLIVQVLMENGYIVPLIFKGALSSRRKESSSAYLFPFAILEFVYYEKETRQVQTASSVSLVEDFPEVRIDFDTQTKAVEFLRKGVYLIKPGQSCPEIFDILIALYRNWSIVRALDENLLWAGFLLKILTFSGFAPAMNRCASCQGQLIGNVKFSPSQGGLICGECDSPTDAQKIEPKTVDILQFLLAKPFRSYDKLKCEPNRAKSLRNMIEKFWIYHIGQNR
ncbi:DNA repair protein RecO [bacterium]|mgnify:CR=1 FL=1|nr:MAG: DNA repair protein RecO [bacterium]